MAASATAIRVRGISVTTWGVRCHGNTFVADDSSAGAENCGMRTCAEIRVTKVGREVARLAKEQPGESGIGGLGNKKVTSKRDYMYQRLDGESSFFFF